jgi:hypothetical protein
MSRVSIVLDMPAPEYRALVAVANTRGIQAHVLVEQLVHHALTTYRPTPASAPTPNPEPKPKPKYVPMPMANRSMAMIRSDRDEQLVTVAKLHGQGLSDGQIAARIVVSAGTVLARRRHLNLPPVGNRGRPRKTITEPESEAI